MAAIDSKFHLKIGEFGFLLAKQARTERHIYTREEAPAFVNKFSSGDPNYRDATFFPHWVQLNWQNGFDQEFFDDGGRFFRSSQVDPTLQEKLTLQKAIGSAGSISNSGARSFGLRSASSSGWWDTNYDYRRKITVTAPSGIAIPEGYPVVVDIDTAALETAGKVLANRNDWRVVYAPDSSFTDLVRHYVDTDVTVFGAQAAISAGQEDGNYYVYYGYSSESTNKQPTDDDEWNEVYVPETDADTVFLLHCKEGTGSSVEDTKGSYNGTLVGSAGWTSDGKFGFAVDLPGAAGDYISVGQTNLDDLTFDCFIKKDSTSTGGYLLVYRVETSKMEVSFTSDGKIKVGLQGDTGFPELTTATAVIDDTDWHHIGITFDGVDIVKVYVDNVPHTELDFSGFGQSNMIRSGNSSMYIGKDLDCKIAHIRLSNDVRTSFSHALSEEPTVEAGDETAQAAAAGGGVFEIFAGDDEGVIYKWDNLTTWEEQFSCRRLQWFDTVADVDTNLKVGDDGDTEKATAQSFQLDDDSRVKGVQVYLRKSEGTPGDITVRIETDDTNAPSGDLADANLETTIPAFTTTDYGWVTVEFPAASSAVLDADTVYWIVLKTAAAGTDNNYEWGADGSSPSYDDGSIAASTDGGSSWTADATKDALFRVLAESTRVNQITQAAFSGTVKLYFATGDPTNTHENNARIYSYNGSVWALEHTFTGTGSAAVLSLQVFSSKLYAGLSPTCKIMVTEDGNTWTTSKDLDDPDNPGYPWDMEVYNQRLYVAGGHPEYSHDNNSLGFLWMYDEYAWQFVYDFSFTVIKSLAVFDGLLFIGTIDKKLYVFNTASIDKLFEFPWDVSLNWMDVWDDKLVIGLTGTGALTGQEAIYVFDRNGFHKAFVPSGSVGVLSGLVARNELLVGTTGTGILKVNPNTYVSSGWLQHSYFEAQLPNIPKLYRSVELIFDALPTGCSIQVDYRTDESEDWTTLGTTNTQGETEETFDFGSGVYSYKISIRVTLTTTNTGVTPTLKKVILKYVLSPDFKYMWKMKLLCCDNIIWLDGTEPAGIIGEAVEAGDTTLTFRSTDKSVPTEGFPDPNGEAMYATVEDSEGNKDVFTYTGKTDTTLTGIPATGDNALGAHEAGEKIRITGANLHKKILDLKQARLLYTFTDIDGLEHTALFHAYQADNWVINLDDYAGGLENEVPITLLEA